MNPSKDAKQGSKSINPTEMAGLGMEIAAPICLGVWISSQWSLGIWPILAGLLIGLVGGTAHVIVFLKRQQDSLRSRPSGASGDKRFGP